MAIYESSKRKEYIEKLELTLSICSLNTEDALRKVMETKKKLEKLEEKYNNCKTSQSKVEMQIRDFYGGLEGNVKNY